MNENRPSIEGSAPLRLRSHSIHIENRELMSITGVKDVMSFNENEIVLMSDGGGLTIDGNDLHITKLNLDDGQVVAVEYDDMPAQRGSLFSRMFR